MKINHFILFILFSSDSLFCQIYEVGYIHGKSNFIGDVGSTKFINPFQKNVNGNGVSGFSLKWNRSPRHSIKLTFIKSNLIANDINSKDPRRIERGYSFSIPISEISAGIEFNMLDFNLHEDYDIFSPYLYTGLSFSKFNEILLQENNLISGHKKNKSLGIPMIVGLKIRFLEKFIFSIEGGARYVFSDDIDGNSSFNYNFGNINNNDWYFFSSLGISYTFGRRPCYCNVK
mgnify:CR=1 FL=1